jgi:hypothetical protein
VLIPRGVIAAISSPMALTAERPAERADRRPAELTSERPAKLTDRRLAERADRRPVELTDGPAERTAALPGPVSAAAPAPAVSEAGLPRRTRTLPRVPEPAASASMPLAAPTLTVVTEAGAPAGETTGPGNLPRRVRQANLVPQLRPDSPVPAEPEQPEAAERRPEEARALFSAFQAGTRRGREEHGDDLTSQQTGEKEDK